MNLGNLLTGSALILLGAILIQRWRAGGTWTIAAATRPGKGTTGKGLPAQIPKTAALALGCVLITWGLLVIFLG